jgi:hypothetical protein
LDFKDLTRGTEQKALSVGQKFNVQEQLLTDLSDAADGVNNALIHLLEATQAAESSVGYPFTSLISIDHGGQS